MKKAIVTIVVGEQAEKVWEVTGTGFLSYAEKCGAELIVINSIRMWMPMPFWCKFDLWGLLTRFDRILYLDADILIRPDCPDLFAIVPEEKVGMFNEGKFSPRSLALHDAKVQMKEDLPAWDGISYYNAGVMLVSKQHRFLFEKPDPIPRFRYWTEQTLFNWRLFKNRVPMHDLNWKFNRMSLMNKHLGVSRLDSYMVHYAGPEPLPQRVEQMKKDLARWVKDVRAPVDPDTLEGAWEDVYQPCVFLDVGGGIGDQICAEPAIRYLSMVLLPKAEIKLMTVYPRLFRHLQSRIEVATKFDAFKRDAIKDIKTHPEAQSSLQTVAIRNAVSHHFIHGVDYASMAILRRTLPNSWKTPAFLLEEEDRKETELYKVDVLVHPGKGWPINTFPLGWWEKVIEGICDLNLTVGIVGKDVSPEHGVLNVPIFTKYLDQVVDLRNKLTLGGLMAMIEKTPVLLTNDSSPVHLAGCWDNQIVLIPTCKHPDHLLPWRCGSQKHKAAAIYTRLLDDVFPALPTLPEWNVNRGPTDPRSFLPDPEVVIQEVATRHTYPFVNEGIPRSRREIKAEGEPPNAYPF